MTSSTLIFRRGRGHNDVLHAFGARGDAGVVRDRMSTTAVARAAVAGRRKIPMVSIASRFTSPSSPTTTDATTTDHMRGRSAARIATTNVVTSGRPATT
jgi:hypothetical protein